MAVVSDPGDDGAARPLGLWVRQYEQSYGGGGRNMVFAWTKTRYSPIGVDFGADSLKLLQIIPTDPPQIITAAAVELPEHARLDPAARQAFFAEALKSLLKQRAFKGRRAVCSIPAYQTLVQHLQIARVEHEDFESQIGLQLRQRLNVDPTRMVVRHFEVAQVVRDGVAKQEVVCLAASRDAVLRHLDIARRAKLDVIGMTCEPLAILRAFAHLFRGSGAAERTTCFIDLGSATTKVVIAHGSELVFAKMIHAAGDHMTRHRAKADATDFMAARQARMREAAQMQAPAATATAAPVAAAIGAPVGATSPHGSGMAILDAQIAAERGGSRPAPRGGGPGTPAPAGDEPGADTIDCLIDELQLSVRYHQSVFPNRPIEKLVFLGGEARQVALCQKIARALRIGAQLGDPLARLLRVNQLAPPLGVDIDQPQPGWGVPMGLCLEGNE